LKPAPSTLDTRERAPHSGRRFTPTAAIKADRREQGQRREARNERHGEQRQGEQRQRHPQRADGHPAHRPEGGQPKRPFRGRRRRSGGGNRAQAV
jgi:hypothetical protein